VVQKNQPSGERLMTRPEVAEYLRVSVSTVFRLQADPDNPMPEIRIGARGVRYRKSEIDAWLDANRSLPQEALPRRPATKASAAGVRSVPAV
jgi:excisionase family DNA binding protein